MPKDNVQQFFSGPEARRLAQTPAVGEPLWCDDAKEFYVGDGATAGGILIGPPLHIDTPTILRVPDDYPTIHAAIAYANKFKFLTPPTIQVTVPVHREPGGQIHLFGYSLVGAPSAVTFDGGNKGGISGPGSITDVEVKAATAKAATTAAGVIAVDGRLRLSGVKSNQWDTGLYVAPDGIAEYKGGANQCWDNKSFQVRVGGVLTIEAGITSFDITGGPVCLEVLSFASITNQAGAKLKVQYGTPTLRVIFASAYMDRAIINGPVTAVDSGRIRVTGVTGTPAYSPALNTPGNRDGVIFP